MREILRIALNDLRATLGERGTWINIVVVPVFMTVLLATVNRANSSAGTLDVLNMAPGDPAAIQVITALRAGAGATFSLCDYSAGECGAPAALADWAAYSAARVRDGKASASLTIPAGINAALTRGEALKLAYTVRDTLNAPALIGEQVTSALTQLNGTYAAARAVVVAVNPSDPAQVQALYSGVLESARALWAANPVRIVEQDSSISPASGGTGFGQSAPGFGGMFVLINAVGLASLFVVERQTWTMQRLLMMPIAPWQILAGKLAGRYVLGLIIFSTLIGVGIMFGTRFGDLLGVVLTVLTYTLAATAIALAFSTFARTKSQAANLGIMVGLTLAPLGGAWWPLSITPAWMQLVGHLSPIAWSQDAFNKLIFYGGNAFSILPELVILLMFAAIFFTIGLRRFRYL